MASCLLIEATVGVGGGMAFLASTPPPANLPLPWIISQATVLDGVYSCPSGTHILLTPSEVNALNTFKATPEHYAAVSIIFGAALTALAVIWGFRRILKLFTSHTEA